MNIQTLNHTSERLYPHGFFSSHEGVNRDQKEELKGLRSIIMLSMKCLEVMLKRGHVQDGFNRDNLIQDADPYIESLMNMVRHGTTHKD